VNMPSRLWGKVAGGASLISFFTVLAKGLGLLQTAVIADRFGTGMEVDAYTLAFSSVVFTLIIIPRDLLQPFLPLFSKVKEEQGEVAAWRFAGSVGTWMALLAGAATVIGMLHADRLAQWVSDGRDAATVALIGTMIRLMLPAAFFMTLVWQGSLMMHAYKRFGIPALGETINRATTVGVLLALYAVWGIRGLGIGVVLGALVWALLLAGGFGRTLCLLRPSLDLRSPAMRKLRRLMLPILIGTLVAQSRVILNYWFASGMGAGLPGTLGYAKRLSDTIVVLIPFAVGTVIYPYFSEMTARKELRGAGAALAQTLRLMALLFVPLSVGIGVLRLPFVQLIFFRGAFSLADAVVTADLLLFYMAGLTVLAWEIMLMRFYFSAQNTLTPMVVGLGCVALHVAAVALMRETLGVVSIPLAETLSKLTKVVVLLLLIRRITPLSHARENALFLLKLFAAGALMAGAMTAVGGATGVRRGLSETVGLSAAVAQLVVPMALCAVVGLLVFGGTLWLMRVREVRVAWQWGVTWIGRGRGGNRS
jgi:putative peptidoglycan lipid II flippase